MLIRVDIHSLHEAACPHCGVRTTFDNRDGRLDHGAQRQPAAHDFATMRPAASPAPALRERPAERPAPRPARAPRPPSGSNGSWRDYRRLGQAALQRSRSILRTLPSSAPDALGRLQGHWPLLAALSVLGLCFFLAFVVSLHMPGLYLDEPAHYLSRLASVQPNRIVDRNGTLIAELFSNKTGQLTPESMPRSLAAKLVFVEDEDFFRHGGLDWGAISRAMLINVATFGYSQGGSTLTQQLARILLGERQKAIVRKVREAALAYYLEGNLAKDQILAAYMNHVYLGHGAYGMEIAARFYFEKPLDQLSFAEELALVCLPSAPERLSPLRHPELLEAKMRHVYERMRDDDFPSTPEPEEFDRQLIAAFGGMNRSPTSTVFGTRTNDAPYVAEHVRLQIRRILGESFEFDAGLTVETTIDRALQVAARSEVEDFVQRTSPNFPPVIMREDRVVAQDSPRAALQREYMQTGIGPMLFGMPGPIMDSRPRMQAAAIGVEATTGEVLFMQGGTSFSSDNQINRAVHMRRQTGSAIKPVVYSAGIESGAVTAATLLDDRPLYVSQRGRTDTDRDYWLPGNYSGVYEGRISVREALMRSQNIPAIRVLELTGLPRVGEQFRKFFFPGDSAFDSRFRSDETVAIGSLEMSPLEMAVAFSAFANGGQIRRPFLIRSIRDPEGHVLYESGADEFQMNTPEDRVALSPEATEVMISLLRDSGRYGGTSRGGFNGLLIGKTGTSNEHRDAWFVGAIPGVSAAVWVGFDNPAYSMNGGTGSNLAGPIWGRIMKHARARGNFNVQSRAVRLDICPESGLLYGPGCSQRVSEIFLPDHRPTETHRAPERPGAPGGQTWSVNRDSDFE